jgi:hypothetical protein
MATIVEGYRRWSLFILVYVLHKTPQFLFEKLSLVHERAAYDQHNQTQSWTLVPDLYLHFRAFSIYIWNRIGITMNQKICIFVEQIAEYNYSCIYWSLVQIVFFLKNRSLKSLTFETWSKLRRIEESAFSRSGLCKIIIPAGPYGPPVTVCSFARLLNLDSWSRK